jgi:hypothetical protein
MPAFNIGEAETFELRTMMLSSIESVSVFSIVLVPLTVRFPVTVRSLLTVTVPVKVGDADGALAFSCVWMAEVTPVYITQLGA